MTAKEKLAETVFDSVGDMMSAYAEEAVRVAWSDHRRRLDMDDPSVDVLEDILGGQAAVDLEFQTRLWGGYFGEVLRRRFGGQWELTQYPGKEVAVPTLLVGDSRLYPQMKVFRRLTLGNGENLISFYKMVSERLAKDSAAVKPS